MKLSVIIIFLFLSGFYLPLSAQQDYQKMLEEAKKTINSDQDMDPALKKQMLQMMNSDKVKKGMSVAQGSYHPAIELTALPKRDERRLGSISTQQLSNAGAMQYIQNLSANIEKQLNRNELSQAKVILSKTGATDRDISNAGTLSWYEGKPKLALYLAAKSAGKPQNIMAMSNLAGMLNMAGYEEKAVPLLLFVLQKDDKNSTALNNLGRAYLGLGDKKKAEQYYLQCVALAPTHPEANNALGCLYEEAGNPVKAKEYFEKSLEGGYNEEALRHIEKQNPQQPIILLIAKHHKAPAYFNQFKFQVPEECYKYEDYYRIRDLHKSFENGISVLEDEYFALLNENEEKSNQQLKEQQQKILQALSAGTRPEGPLLRIYPFAPLAGRVLPELSREMDEVIARFKRSYQKDIDDLKARHHQKAKEITDAYEAQYQMGEMGECGICCLNCDEVNKAMCKAHKKSTLEFQRAAASIHKDFVDKSRLQLTGYFDEAVYWFALLGPSQEMFNVNFYKTVIGFLSAIRELSENTPFLIGPTTCDGKEAPKFDAATNKYAQVDKPDCPIDISIPFIIGKLKLDCSSFSISGGEGVTGSYSKNFVTGQSTLSIGAGLTFEAGAKGVSASVGASEAVYMTFDRDGSFRDTGLKFSASAEVSAGPASVGGGGGYTLGMNSGWDFTSNAPSATISL